jgi:transcriptional regulator with XRE-family HTH domain
MAPINEELKQKRESKGKTLEDVSESTRISLKFLKAVEKGQMELLPGEFYIKSILRAYSKYLGLNEKAVLDKYYQEENLNNHISTKNTNGSKTSSYNPKSKNFVINFSISIIILLLVSLSVYLISHDTEKKKISVDEDLKLTEKSASVPGPKTKEKKNLTIDISIVEETWLQIFIDGKMKAEGIKKPEEHFKFNASNEIILNLGNAGGINYRINNQEGKSFGPSGDVKKNIKITLENFHQFLKKKNNPERTIKKLQKGIT